MSIEVAKGAPIYARIEQAPSQNIQNLGRAPWQEAKVNSCGRQEWISRSWRSNFYAATDNMHASRNYEKGFFRFVLRWSLEARLDWKKKKNARVWKHGRIGRSRSLPARSKHTKTINITLSDSVLFFLERSLIPFWARTTRSSLFVDLKRLRLEESYPGFPSNSKNPILTAIWIESNRIQNTSLTANGIRNFRAPHPIHEKKKTVKSTGEKKLRISSCHRRRTCGPSRRRVD